MGHSDDKARREAREAQEEMEDKINQQKAEELQKKKDLADKNAAIMKRRFSLLNTVSRNDSDKSQTLG